VFCVHGYWGAVRLKNGVLELMELKHRIVIVLKDSHFVIQKLHVPYGADVKDCCSKHSELHSTSSIFLASSVQSACTLQPVQEGALPVPRRPNTADTTVNQLHSPLVLTSHLSESHHNVIHSSPWSLKWPFRNRFSLGNSLHAHLPLPTFTDPSLMSSEFN
jgi:hypothetical protein